MIAGNDRTVGRYLGRCAIDRDALDDGTNRCEIALPRPGYVGNDVNFRGDRDDVRKNGEIILDINDIKRAEHRKPPQTGKGDEVALITGYPIFAQLERHEGRGRRGSYVELMGGAGVIN